MRLLPRLLAVCALCAFAVPALADVALDPPSVTVVDASREWITLKIVAGPNGLPGGFSVWWMKKSDFIAQGGWPTDGYTNQYVNGCDFTGDASLFTFDGSAYVLAPGQQIEVRMGYVYDESGVSASSYAELNEGTTFEFHAYALGATGYYPSVFGPTVEFSTVTRTSTDCTLTQGYWKNHPSAWSRVSTMFLGNVSYTNAQLMQIFNTPANGNGLISLAHQLIAAKLNVLLGAVPVTQVQNAITQADALIGNLVVPPIGSGFLAPADTDALTNILDQFNSGQLGTTHCPDTGTIVPTTPTTWGRIKMLYR